MLHPSNIKKLINNIKEFIIKHLKVVIITIVVLVVSIILWIQNQKIGDITQTTNSCQNNQTSQTSLHRYRGQSFIYRSVR